MKRILLFFVLAAIGLSAYSCNDKLRPEGAVVRQDRQISDFFHIVNIGSGLKAYITTGSTDKVEVETNENLQSYIETYVTGNALVVRVKSGTNISGNPTIIIHVSVSALSILNCTGGSNVFLANTAAMESMSTVLSGGSSLQGEIMVDDFECSVSGGSVHNITGKAVNCVAQLTGGSKANQFALVADNLEADLSGGSQMQITINNSFNIEASGGSRLEYKGAGTGTVNASGGSTVERK